MKDRIEARLAQPVRKPDQVKATKDAYNVLSRNLNIIGGGDNAVLRALTEEHSTLLGQLLNSVLDAIALREGDGRFSPEVHKIAAETRNWFV